MAQSFAFGKQLKRTSDEDMDMKNLKRWWYKNKPN